MKTYIPIILISTILLYNCAQKIPTIQYERIPFSVPDSVGLPVGEYPIGTDEANTETTIGITDTTVVENRNTTAGYDFDKIIDPGLKAVFRNSTSPEGTKTNTEIFRDISNKFDYILQLGLPADNLDNMIRYDSLGVNSPATKVSDFLKKYNPDIDTQFK